MIGLSSSVPEFEGYSLLDLAAEPPSSVEPVDSAEMDINAFYDERSADQRELSRYLTDDGRLIPDLENFARPVIRGRIAEQFEQVGSSDLSVSISDGRLAGVDLVAQGDDRIQGRFEALDRLSSDPFGDVSASLDALDGDSPDPTEEMLDWLEVDPDDLRESLRAKEAVNEVQEIKVETQGGASSLSLKRVRELLPDATSISHGSRSVLNLPDGKGGIVFGDGDEQARFESLIQTAEPEPLADISVGNLPGDPDLSGELSDRETRRRLRNQLDETLEAEGYDPGEWNTDARADGTLILQDPETNRTRTIEAGDDLDSTVDSFGGDSDVQPESDGGGSGEQGGDGLDRRAVGAGLIVAAAAAYGVLQK